ncbi:hypothetical protein D3C73_1606530 [compost metagenome]
MKSSLEVSDLPYCRPGFRISGLPATSAALPSSSEKLKPKIARVQMVMISAPAISRQALMI